MAGVPAPQKAVYYDPETGDLRGHVICQNPETNGVLPGNAVLVMGDNEEFPNPHEHYRVQDGKIVEKSEHEKRALALPKRDEVDSLIRAELDASDKTQVADYPITDMARSEWATYRQALRRLSDLRDPIRMIEAWPLRPDETDAATALRARLP